MAIEIIKGDSTYIPAELVNGKTVLQESNLVPLRDATKDNSANLRNTVTTIKIKASDFEEVGDGMFYKVVVNHPYRTKWINVSSYSDNTNGGLSSIVDIVEVTRDSQFEIWNDKAEVITSVIVFDLI